MTLKATLPRRHPTEQAPPRPVRDEQGVRRALIDTLRREYEALRQLARL